MLSLFDHAALKASPAAPKQPDFEALKQIDPGLLPRSGAEARRIGSSYFFSGLACRHGHVAPRYTAGGSCSWCTRIRSAKQNGHAFKGASVGLVGRKFRAEAADSETSTYVPARPCKHGHRLRWVSSGNCVDCDKATRKRQADKIRTARIRKEYGLDADQHEALFVKQGQTCAICPTQFERRSAMHVDHCHATGRVRGLLCSKCNQALGLLNDDTALLRKAMEYLYAHAS